MPVLPDRMISHWGIDGRPNGWMPRGPAVFLMPVIGVFMLLLFMVITRLEPAKSNIESFIGAFDTFVTIFILFFVYISSIMLASNMNMKFDFEEAMAPAFAGLMYAISLLIGRTKPNLIVGIRTKETLNDPEVWQKVHGKGAELFRYCALICLGGLFLPRLLPVFMLVPMFVTSVYLASYAKKISKKQ
jgi:uncharacterized membrane protein